jgi:hypothetical protein
VIYTEDKGIQHIPASIVIANNNIFQNWQITIIYSLNKRIFAKLKNSKKAPYRLNKR